MKLNKINTTEISKFFSSAAVIYGSALVQHVLTNASRTFNVKNTLCLNYGGSSSSPSLGAFKSVILNETAFSFGGYKLVDSVFSFDSIDSKANAAAAFTALGSIFYGKIAGHTLLSKETAVNIICEAAAAYLLTYINSEEQPNFELVIDAEHVAVDLVGFDKVAEVEAYINTEEAFLIESFLDVDFI